ICEYWSDKAKRWIQADAQLDDVHRDHLPINFDCTDLGDDAFIAAGQAWKLARSGKVSPDAFGHADARGFWFLRVNVHRDLLALTNQYMSRWDTWRLSTPASKVLSPAEMASADRLAEQSEAIDLNSGEFDRLK